MVPVIVPRHAWVTEEDSGETHHPALPSISLSLPPLSLSLPVPLLPLSRCPSPSFALLSFLSCSPSLPISLTLCSPIFLSPLLSSPLLPFLSLSLPLSFSLVSSLSLSLSLSLPLSFSLCLRVNDLPCCGSIDQTKLQEKVNDKWTPPPPSFWWFWNDYIETPRRGAWGGGGCPCSGPANQSFNCVSPLFS